MKSFNELFECQNAETETELDVLVELNDKNRFYEKIIDGKFKGNFNFTELFLNENGHKKCDRILFNDGSLDSQPVGFWIPVYKGCMGR